jgi:hypothetical protein
MSHKTLCIDDFTTLLIPKHDTCVLSLDLPKERLKGHSDEKFLITDSKRFFNFIVENDEVFTLNVFVGVP